MAYECSTFIGSNQSRQNSHILEENHSSELQISQIHNIAISTQSEIKTHTNQQQKYSVICQYSSSSTPVQFSTNLTTLPIPQISIEPPIPISINTTNILQNKSPLPFEVETPTMTNRTSPKVSKHIHFPPHQRDPIPFSVETPNHDNSRMHENTYPQKSNSPPVANNDLDLLKKLRIKYQNNPAIGYLNINSLRGQKFSQLEQICKTKELDIMCIDETKLTTEIPTAKFNLPGYQYPPIRRDRISNSNSFGGGKMVYIKEGVICKRVDNLETKTAETICLELSLKNKKWFIMFGYRPESINRDVFFQEVNLKLDKAINKYENILSIGDLNIDLSIKNVTKIIILRICVILLI